MNKPLALCCALLAFAAASLSAASATQKAAFKAEKKATAVSLAATKKAVAAITRANDLEARANALLDALPAESTVKTPAEFVAARCDAALAKATEHWGWIGKTNEQIATARAAWNASQKAAATAEKSAFNALTPAEKLAYKASLAAAIAFEAAGDAADDAITQADYANATFEERVTANDARDAEIANLEFQASLLSPAQFVAAKVAYYAEQYANMKDAYLHYAGLTPTARLDEIAADTALDPDPATADDVDIADGDRFE